MLRAGIKNIIRKAQRLVGLSVVRRKRLREVMSELEAARRDLEMARMLLSPVTLSAYHQRNLEKHHPSLPVSQIFLSDSDQEPGTLLQSCIESVQRCFHKDQHNVYNDEEIRNLIRSHFDGDVLDAYINLRPFAYKADLARLCILAVVGGWYVDVGTLWTVPVRLPHTVRLFTARDIGRNTKSSWGCNNGIIYANRNHPALFFGIETIVKHFKARYYGQNPLCPTGPNVWGKAVAANCELAETLFCDLYELTPDRTVKNEAFVMDDGLVFAYKKPGGGGGGLVSYGELGTNDYNDFWRRRNIYGEE